MVTTTHAPKRRIPREPDVTVVVVPTAAGTEETRAAVLRVLEVLSQRPQPSDDIVATAPRAVGEFAQVERPHRFAIRHRSDHDAWRYGSLEGGVAEC